MRLYHRTWADNATSILRDGFKDGEGNYLTDEKQRGVWLSDRPLESNEGAWGDVLLAVEIDPELIADYEWVEVGKPYREFLVPAALINDRAAVTGPYSEEPSHGPQTAA